MKFFKKRPKRFKHCPRCGNRCMIDQTKCEECDLVFARLSDATNRAARKKLRHFDTDFVLYTSDLPRDVKWWKLLLICGFGGLFGAHYYYVGKYIKGGLMSAAFVLALFCTVFNANMAGLMETALLYVPIGIMGLSWLVSFSFIILKKFKVPIAIDEAQNLLDEHRRIEKQLAKQARKDRRTNKNRTENINPKEVGLNEEECFGNEKMFGEKTGEKTGVEKEGEKAGDEK